MEWDSAHVAGRGPGADLDRARAGYADKLGLEAVEERPGGLRYELGGTEFALYLSGGRSDSSFTQLAIYVEDLAAAVAELRGRGVVFEEYEIPGLETTGGIAEIDGNYPSKGTGERAAWFRDLDGNMIGLGQPMP